MRVAPLLVLAAIACSRPGPSPEYAAAREKHAALVAAHPRDAAARPEIDEVVALLDRVPASSPDAPAARELRERLAAERKALADEEARRAEVLEKAGETPAWPSATSIGRPPPKPAPITAGMTVEQLRSAYGECFDAQGPIVIPTADGKERPGETWALRRGDAACAERHPAYRDQVVVVADGAVLAVQPGSTLVTQERTVRHEERREVELVPMAGGKWGIRGASGQVEPVPAGAELRTRDGAPMPPPEPRP